MHPTPSTTASPAPRRRPSSSPTNPHPPGANPQLDAERRAASLRVLNVWSTLADKYARHLDEDDIVDLRTGGLARDRGVLSGMARTWNIGCFADAPDGEDEEPDGEDESDDEIGGWGSGSELDHQLMPLNVPPVQELDPKDAEDLKEFLAAEAAREAKHGREDEAGPDDTSDDDDNNNEANSGDIDTYDPDTEDSIVEVEAGSALALSEEGSSDELDGYDDTVGEGATIYQVKSPQLSPLCRPQTPVQQLRTPPLSYSSFNFAPPNAPIRSSPEKSKPSESRTSSAMELAVSSATPPAKAKAKTKHIKVPFVTPIKRLVPEVVISSRRRASTVAPQAESADEKIHPNRRVLVQSISPSNRHALMPSTSPDTPTKSFSIGSSRKRRASRSSVSSKLASSPEPTMIDADYFFPPASPLPRKPAKRKRLISEDVEEVAPALAVHDAEDEKLPLPRRMPSRSRRRFPSHSHVLPHDTTAPDLSPLYARHSTATPSHSVPCTPTHAHDLTAPSTQLDAQLIFAQAMQSLSYLAFSSPPGSQLGWTHSAPYYLPSPVRPPTCNPVSDLHLPQRSQSHPPPPIHTPPYHPHSHPPPHPPWVFPSYPYPYFSTTHPHTHPPRTSSTSSFVPFPPEFPNSSPLSGRAKGKGKRVSFPDESPETDDGDDGKEESADEGQERARPKKARPRRCSSVVASCRKRAPDLHASTSSASHARLVSSRSKYNTRK